MARRKGAKVMHKAKMTIPLAIVAGAVPGVIDVVKNGQSNGWGTDGSDSGMTTLLGDFFWHSNPRRRKRVHRR